MMRILKLTIAEYLKYLGTIVLTVALTACGGADSGDNTAAPEADDASQQQTDLYINLTDAEGDFLVYEVDVTSISLTRGNGQVVEVLPFASRVDFAQYVELSELLTVATVPAGQYREIALNLDFADAEVIVQDSNGKPVSASVTDASGQPLTHTSITMQLQNRDQWLLVPGVPAIVTLDFDLDASNTITFEQSQATVSVQPVLLADTLEDVAPIGAKPIRLRGLLDSVDRANGEVALDLRPFQIRDRSFAHVAFQTTADTYFEVNQTEALGDQGLALLADLASDSAMVVLGVWDRQQRRFIADEVYAGTSVPWYQADMLRGVVVARSGNVVQVRGSTLEFAEGDRVFNDTVTMYIEETTRVIKRGDSSANIEDISVGSVVYATGAIEGEHFDASAGFVRIYPGQVAGTVVSASPLAIDITLLNGRRPQIYDFSGTGITVDSDADSAHYEIATTTLELIDLDIDDPIRIHGYVNDFGTAPEDFTALSVISGANMRAQWVVGYGIDGADSAFARVDSDGIVMDLQDTQFRHHIVTAAATFDLTALTEVPLLYSESLRGLFTLCQRGRVHIYTEFAEYATALEQTSIEGNSVVKVNATGLYDASQNTFDANRIQIVLKAD